MGAGASSTNKRSQSGGEVEQKYIPLTVLIRRLKLFQHCSSGDILILVDDELKDVEHVIDKPTDWFRVSIAQKQAKYFEGLQVVTSLRGDQLHQSPGAPSDAPSEIGRSTSSHRDNNIQAMLTTADPTIQKPAAKQSPIFRSLSHTHSHTHTQSHTASHAYTREDPASGSSLITLGRRLTNETISLDDKKKLPPIRGSAEQSNGSLLPEPLTSPMSPIIAFGAGLSPLNNPGMISSSSSRAGDGLGVGADNVSVTLSVGSGLASATSQGGMGDMRLPSLSPRGGGVQSPSVSGVMKLTSTLRTRPRENSGAPEPRLQGPGVSGSGHGAGPGVGSGMGSMIGSMGSTGSVGPGTGSMMTGSMTTGVSKSASHLTHSSTGARSDNFTASTQPMTHTTHSSQPTYNHPLTSSHTSNHTSTHSSAHNSTQNNTQNNTQHTPHTQNNYPTNANTLTNNLHRTESDYYTNSTHHSPRLSPPDRDRERSEAGWASSESDVERGKWG
jgi:hypothetical protein